MACDFCLMDAPMLFSVFANRLRPVGVLRKFMRTSMALLAIYALAGCATTLSARVTSFQKWPGGVQGETYRLVRGADQPDSLEYQTYADMVRASIGPVGLVEATAGGKARFGGGWMGKGRGWGGGRFIPAVSSIRRMAIWCGRPSAPWGWSKQKRGARPGSRCRSAMAPRKTANG